MMKGKKQKAQPTIHFKQSECFFTLRSIWHMKLELMKIVELFLVFQLFRAFISLSSPLRGGGGGVVGGSGGSGGGCVSFAVKLWVVCYYSVQCV